MTYIKVHHTELAALEKKLHAIEQAIEEAYQQHTCNQGRYGSCWVCVLRQTLRAESE